MGTLTLKRFNGIEEFQLEEPKIYTARNENQIMLWLETETKKLPLKTLPDTQKFHIRPRAEITICMDESQLIPLEKKHIRIPKGYDEETDNSVAQIHYFEQQPLHNNEVELIYQNNGTFLVHWKATTTDVSFYDGSKPETEIEIQGEFHIHHDSQ